MLECLRAQPSGGQGRNKMLKSTKAIVVFILLVFLAGFIQLALKTSIWGALLICAFIFAAFGVPISEAVDFIVQRWNMEPVTIKLRSQGEQK
jgi:hypothetical protein